MVEITLDYSFLPAEVTDYANDRFDEPARSELVEEALRAAPFPDEAEWFYDDQTLEIFRNPFRVAYELALQEKLNDMLYEVEHGERDDFSPAEIKDFERELRDYEPESAS
jgi:hypothetical protein